MKTFSLLALFFCTCCLSFGSVWTETGDAGHLPATAQFTSGVGALTEIDGKLSDGTGGADMYAIMITDPSLFSVFTVDVNSNYISDPSLFLFDSNGNALFGDDTSSSAQANIPAGTLSALTAGLYYVLITPQGNEPENKNSKLLFNDSPTSGVVGANSLADMVVKDYTKTGDGNSGKYQIDFTGAGFATTPEPASVMLIGAGFLAMGLLKRKSWR